MGFSPTIISNSGRKAEFVYSGAFWEAGLPYPGNQAFVTAYEKEFTRAPAVQSANAYAACQLFVDAVRRTGSLDSDTLREALLGSRPRLSWATSLLTSVGSRSGTKRSPSSGRTASRWWSGPDELLSGKPRFPTPPWSQR